jgi:ribosomal protein S16
MVYRVVMVEKTEDGDSRFLQNVGTKQYDV